MSACAAQFDGILAFHEKKVRDLLDLKVFVDTDADTRLARRLRRDIVHRGRDVLQAGRCTRLAALASPAGTPADFACSGRRGRCRALCWGMRRAVRSCLRAKRLLPAGAGAV